MFLSRRQFMKVSVGTVVTTAAGGELVTSILGCSSMEQKASVSETQGKTAPLSASVQAKSASAMRDNGKEQHGEVPIRYIEYSPNVEVEVENEAQLIDEIVVSMSRSSGNAFDKHRHAIRDAHAKGHGFLKGELIIHKDLPRHLQQGMFAKSATYPIVIRLSSAPGEIQSDTIPAPRGMAIKVIEVEGERLLPQDTGHNQDFLLVNIPVLPFGTVLEYRKRQERSEPSSHSSEFIQRTLAGAARGVEKVVRAIGGEPSATLQSLARDNGHLLGETYHSMAAIRFGEYIAKISVAPLSENVKALTGAEIKDIKDSTMRDIVVEHFRREGAEYVVRAQLCTDLNRMPVEDASVLWPESLSPHQPIATVRIPPQEAYSPARRVYGDEILSFSPWHGIMLHRPLGSIMRVRIKVYERSTQFRHDMNMAERLEPDTITQIPD